MFMVASSVVSTILILNYHHRNPDTHEMSEWVILYIFFLLLVFHYFPKENNMKLKELVPKEIFKQKILIIFI